MSEIFVILPLLKRKRMFHVKHTPLWGGGIDPLPSYPYLRIPLHTPCLQMVVLYGTVPPATPTHL